MHDYIRPQLVMTALQYLKANNPYYSKVKINKHWYTEVCNDDDFNGFLPDVTTQDNSVEENTKSTEKTIEIGEKQIAVDITHDDDVPLSTEQKTVKIKARAGNNCPTIKSSNEDENTDVNSDDEYAEEQMALDKKAEITVEASPTCIQIDSLDNTTFTIAPSEGNTPEHIVCDNEMEYKCFPDYFPSGKGGYYQKEPRETNLCLRRYFNTKILNVNGHFGEDYEYVFALQYAIEFTQLDQSQSVRLRMSQGCNLNGKKITAGVVRDKTFITEMVMQDHAYKFMNQVRGTPAYWQGCLFNVLAMMKSLGKPTWFLTLSPAEFMWPEIIQAVGARDGITFTDEDVSAMPWSEKAYYLRKNPVINVQMFDHRLQSFFTDYLKSSAHPLGEIEDFVIKIEFQARGSPHAHCLLWVKDAPVADVDDDEKICNFIDKYCTGNIPEIPKDCTCELPEDVSFEDITNLAKKLQSHSHSSYCRKHKNKLCRFGFPKLPSPRTLVCRPIDKKHSMKK